jgi:hypothetical protein
VQLPIGEWIESFRTGIGLVPPAVIAMVLLGGPTAGWLLYRFVVQPRTARMRAFARATLWVCPNCRSVNDLRLRRCYRCDAQPADEDLELVDAHPMGPRRLTPVGPGSDMGGQGLDLGGPRPLPRPRPLSRLETRSAGWETDTSAWSSETDEEWEDDLQEQDRAAMPDIAAMTEAIQAPGRRRSARPPSSIPVGPGRPAVARPRRVAVVGQTGNTDDDPPAA